jgi:hypothetical protein
MKLNGGFYLIFVEQIKGPEKIVIIIMKDSNKKQWKKMK